MWCFALRWQGRVRVKGEHITYLKLLIGCNIPEPRVLPATNGISLSSASCALTTLTHLYKETALPMSKRNPRPLESLLLPLKPECLQFRPQTHNVTCTILTRYSRCIHRFLQYERPVQKRRFPRKRSAAVAIVYACVPSQIWALLTVTSL